MLADLSVDDIILRLRHAQSVDHLSASARSRAAQLADRLEIGVRIALLGPKTIGKSGLCDVLLGHLPDNSMRGTTRIFSTGETASRTGLESSGLTTIAHVPMTAHRLGRVQVVDVEMPAEDEAMDKVTTTVLADADIVLWCTEHFTKAEASLWAHASEPLKDHSFLVLTKADEVAEKGQLQARVDELQDIVAEEFHGFFTTSTRKVHDLLKRGKRPTEGELSASGVKALVDALSHVAASGRRADMDGALLFLERHGLAQEKLAADPLQRPSEGVGPSTLYHVARDKIVQRAIDLAEITFDTAAGDVSRVLECCGTISEELVEIITGADDVREEDKKWCSAFEDASDQIMLMTLENDTRSAADAVTVLLQLRRDLEQLAV